MINVILIYEKCTTYCFTNYNGVHITQGKLTLLIFCVFALFYYIIYHNK